MTKILVSDPVTDAGMAILQDAGFEVKYLPDSPPEDKAEACKDVAGWVVRSGTKVTAEMIESANQLRVIGRAGVGVDNIDIPKATRRGILVMNTPNASTYSAAEHTMAMMLALSRNIPKGHGGIMDGKWNRNALVGTELRNKTLGVVGLGKIGREVIKRCRAFDMNILGFDPYVSQEMFTEEEIKIVDLDKLTQVSDYITVHVPLTDSTRSLFDYERLCIMKPTARIINVARGGVIDEVGLAQALNEGKIAGAAIDVFSSEPVDKSNPLLRAKNIVLTPHLGASTKEAKEGVSQAVCEQVRDYLLKDKPINAINMPISNLAKLKEIQPHLDLAEIIGKLQSQLGSNEVKKIYIECAGKMDKAKPTALAFLKGFLADRVQENVNYINVETLAANLGINIEYSVSTDNGNYSNAIKTLVTDENLSHEINGSVFEGNQLRLVNILGFEMDIIPFGTMLFIRNKDYPGVIGKVGATLGDANVNIGAYLLNRSSENGEAFAVIRVDNPVSNKTIEKLFEFPEIISLHQIIC